MLGRVKAFTPNTLKLLLLLQSSLQPLCLDFVAKLGNVSVISCVLSDSAETMQYFTK